MSTEPLTDGTTFRYLQDPSDGARISRGRSSKVLNLGRLPVPVGVAATSK
jgi:hypothetical protein